MEQIENARHASELEALRAKVRDVVRMNLPDMFVFHRFDDVLDLRRQPDTLVRLIRQHTTDERDIPEQYSRGQIKWDTPTGSH
jgi:hypothetical protein